MGISGKIARYFQHSAMTPLLAIILLLLGVFATLVTPREEEPQIDVTMANVFIPFPGASVKDVESLVATPAEQVLSRMSGVEHVYSVSRLGMAVLTVQFEVGVPNQSAVVRLFETMHSHKDWLPPGLGVGEPIIKPKGIDDVPIVALTFWTKDLDRTSLDLQAVARAAEVELKRVPGTRDVSSIAGPGRAIRVSMDAEKMNVFGVTAQDLKNALQASNGLSVSGQLVANNKEIMVQTGAYLESVKDVKSIVLAVRAGKPVYVADIAQVVDGAESPAQFAWHGVNGEEFPAITVQVSKKPGVNAADVANALVQRIEQLKGVLIPAGVEVSVTRNYGASATDKAEKLIGKLVFATSAVILLVLFALGKREALIVGIAVTLTLAATLFASWAWGFTLNRVSLFALIFSIGILVDDAIVVVENIHRWQALYPEKPLYEIIPGAVDEVGGPTILATLTVIAALLPMAFVSGLMGPYMSPIPINSSLGMFISLAVAFIVTPWLAGKVLAHSTHAAQVGGVPVQSKLDSALSSFFTRLLTPFLHPQKGGKARKGLWLGVLALIIGSVALAVVKLVVLKMLPFDNKSEFQIVLDMPVGTPVEETARVLRALSAVVAEVPEVSHYQAYAGTAAPINFNGLVRQYYLRANPEMGDIQVNLVDKAKRSRKSHEIASSVRELIQATAKKMGGNAKVVEVPPGPPVLSPLVAEIYGPDYTGQQNVAKRVRAAFEKTPHIVAIDDSVEANAPKLTLHVLQNKAALLGVAQSDILEVVRMGLSGEDVTPAHNTAAKFDVPVRIRLPEHLLGHVNNVLKLRVRAREGVNAGQLVAISELVEVRQGEREKAIYHKDLLPVVYVLGDSAGPLDSPLYGLADIRQQLDGASLDQIPQAAGVLDEFFIRQPSDPFAGFSLKWDGELQVTYETFRDMGLAYAVGLVLIYLLVVAQFKSYLVPLVIMAPIPLTIIGVMPGHALLGSQFTATSMIGMIALAGIIVRNSILLVDFVNELVSGGVPFAEAIVQSAAVRAKPIALTALAAMLGAVFILDDPIFNGLAISLIFGIMVSTLLTLLVIPVLYYAAFRRRFV